MPEAPHNVMSFLRTVAGAWRDDLRDDTELLARFVNNRDDVAFQTMVWRHGPMVWRTCKRILRNNPDVEDAFQVTFLALTRQADKLRGSTLAGWLHQVARRTALNTNLEVRRRRKLEHQSHTPTQTEAKDLNQTELYAVLDEELANLPQNLRVPLVLRYLEEKTQDEVARILGRTRKAIQKRLARGEAILRQRLERRGLALGAVLIAELFGKSDGISAVPHRLIESTARAGMAFRAGKLTGVTADGAQKLLRGLTLEGAIKKLWWVVVACVGTFGLGEGCWIAWKMFGDSYKSVKFDAPTSLAASQLAKLKTDAELHKKRVDLYGDPLPEGAIARIGTVRFRGWGTSMNLRNEEDTPRCALSPNGKFLAMPCKDQRMYIWDVNTGEELYKNILNRKEYESAAFSSDNKWLAVSMTNGFVRLLDTTTGKLRKDRFEGTFPTFAPDGKTLACLSFKGRSVIFHDIDSKESLDSGISVKAKSSFTFPTAFSHDSQYFFCADVNGMIHLLSVKNGEEKATLKCGQRIVTLTLAVDDKVIAAGEDNIVRVWDWKSGKELRQLCKTTKETSVIALLPDNKTVLAACAGQVCFWDIITGQESRPPLNCKGLLQPILVSNDGLKLVERLGNTIRQ